VPALACLVPVAILLGSLQWIRNAALSTRVHFWEHVEMAGGQVKRVGRVGNSCHVIFWTWALSALCVQCQLWLFLVGSWFRIFQVCFSGICWMLLRWFQLLLLLLVSLLLFYFHMCWFSVLSSLCFRIFSASFFVTFYPCNCCCYYCSVGVLIKKKVTFCCWKMTFILPLIVVILVLTYILPTFHWVLRPLVYSLVPCARQKIYWW